MAPVEALRRPGGHSDRPGCAGPDPLAPRWSSAMGGRVAERWNSGTLEDGSRQDDRTVFWGPD